MLLHLHEYIQCVLVASRSSYRTTLKITHFAKGNKKVETIDDGYMLIKTFGIFWKTVACVSVPVVFIRKGNSDT